MEEVVCLANLKPVSTSIFLDKYCYIPVFDKILLVAKLFEEIEERNNVYNKCKLDILILLQLVSIF